MTQLHGVAWRVSTKSTNQGGNDCVEAGPYLDGTPRIAIRDTKDRTGPALVFHTADWDTLIGDIKAGGRTAG